MDFPKKRGFYDRRQRRRFSSSICARAARFILRDFRLSERPRRRFVLAARNTWRESLWTTPSPPLPFVSLAARAGGAFRVP